MPTIVLGMAEIAYSQEGGEEGVTTADVAQILEAKYGIMEHFAEAHSEDIQQALINSLEGALENLFLGAPIGDPFSEAGQDIAKEYRHFLDEGEIEHMGIDGVPTKAALEGRSLRFKGKKVKGENGEEGVRRVSFVDTGLMRQAATVWIEQ